MRRHRKLTEKETKSIREGKVKLEDLEENGKVFYYVVKYNKEHDEKSFTFLKKIVQSDIDNITNNDHYFIKGFEKCDIEQECYIMLVKAIEAFDPDRGGDFRSFCRLLFRGRLVSLLQESRRYKNIVMNYSCSLQQPVYSDQEGNVITYEDLVSCDNFDFLDQLCLKEYYESMKDKLNDGLSELESDVYEKYLDGLTYKEGSEELSINKKSFGNAIQRVKSKIGNIFEEDIKTEEKSSKSRKKTKKK